MAVSGRGGAGTGPVAAQAAAVVNGRDEAEAKERKEYRGVPV